LLHLQAGAKRLVQDRQALLSERAQLEQREKRLLEEEQEVFEQERKLPSVWQLQLSNKELTEHTDLLRKTCTALTDAVQEAKSELTDMKDRVKSIPSDLELISLPIDSLLANQADREQEQANLQTKELEVVGFDQSRPPAPDFDRLKKHVDSVKAQVVAHERSVIEMERHALNRLREVSANGDRMKGLEKRRKTAEAKRDEIRTSLASRAEKRRGLIEQHEQVRTKMEEARVWHESLSKLAIELDRGEVQLSTLNERDQRSLQESPRPPRVESPKRDRVSDFLDKYEDDTSSVARRLDKTEKAVAHRRSLFEMERSDWQALWEGKQKIADAMLKIVESRIASMKDKKSLEAIVKELDAQADELRPQLAGQRAEATRLEEKPEVVLLKGIQGEVDDERAKLAKWEMELDARVLAHERELAELDLKEDEMKLEKVEVEAKLALLAARAQAAAKVLDLFKQQLAIAEQRAETLAAQKKRIQGES
jgi:chromosome segregation ATPase